MWLCFHMIWLLTRMLTKFTFLFVDSPRRRELASPAVLKRKIFERHDHCQISVGFWATARVRFHQSCVQWVLWLELILDSGPTLWWKPLLLRRDPSNLKWMLCWIRRRKVKTGNGLSTEMKGRCQIQYSDSVLAVADYVSPVVYTIWSLIILEFWERRVHCSIPCRLSPQRLGSREGKGLFRHSTREDGWYCVVCSEISGK